MARGKFRQNSWQISPPTHGDDPETGPARTHHAHKIPRIKDLLTNLVKNPQNTGLNTKKVIGLPSNPELTSPRKPSEDAPPFQLTQERQG